MPSISYAITACNEHVELDRLLKQLTSNINSKDEIVVQLDTTATDEVVSVIEKYNLIKYYFPLNNDFATFKKKRIEFKRKRKELEEKLQPDNYKIDFDAQLNSVTEPTQRKPVIIGTDYKGNDIYDKDHERLTNYTSRGRPDTGLHDHLIM